MNIVRLQRAVEKERAMIYFSWLNYTMDGGQWTIDHQPWSTFHCPSSFLRHLRLFDQILWRCRAATRTNIFMVHRHRQGKPKEFFSALKKWTMAMTKSIFSFFLFALFSLRYLTRPRPLCAVFSHGDFFHQMDQRSQGFVDRLRI